MGAAEMLGRFRRRSGGPPAGAAAAIADAWRQVVGPAVADHTSPLRRSRAGVLTVACSSAAWAQELTMRRDELVRMLAEAAPDAGVTVLRFSVADHVPAPAAPMTPEAPAPPVPGPRERALGDDAAAGIGDPAVRDLVARAAAAAEARRIRHSPGAK